MGLFTKSDVTKGRKQRGQPSTGDSSSATLNKQRMLQAGLQKQHDAKMAKVKQLLKAGRRPEAKLALTDANRVQKQITQITATLNNLQAQQSAITNARLNVETVKAMKAGSEQLKVEMQAIGGIDNVDDVMADIQETNDVANELQEMVASSMLTGAEVQDDDMLNGLLDDIEAEATTAGFAEPAIAEPSAPVAEEEFPDTIDTELDGLEDEFQ